jgi:hypothetical protein
VVWFKANPRNEAYMRALFAERYPEGVFINIQEEPDWHLRIHDADMIVLLYPDAIGLGFECVERKVARFKKTWASVRALNGRRRDFMLNCGTRMGLRVRRVLERGMVLELFATLSFILITPLLLVLDIARGRR